MTNSLGKSCKDYSFWQPCWWSAIFLPLHLFGESIHNSQALPSIPGDKTLYACYFKTRWCWESLHKLSGATLFFAIVPHYPYGPASCKMDGTAWQYLSIKKDSPCVTLFFVYEMSPVQQSFSGDAENDQARFLAICCSFSKPCCLPLPDFANLRELFLALARLCCLSRLFPTFPSGLAVRRASFRNLSIAACLSYLFQLFLGNGWFLKGIMIGVCSLKALR